MTTHRTTNRAGFSLVELLIAMTLTAIIGAAMTTLFVSQSRLLDVQQKQEFARGVTRSASNIIMSEIRMIERDSGVVAASDSSLTLRVPFAMGIVCESTATVMTIRMLPIDSTVYSGATISGFMFRKADGNYHYVATTTSPPTTTNTVCTGAGIAGLGAGSRTIATTELQPAEVGAPLMFYQVVRYHFGASTAVTGRRGLYRAVPAASLDEEIVAPFDTTARFNYFVNDAKNAQSNAPTQLKQITGIELVMDGVSERPNANGTYTTVPLRTAVFFKNRKE